ncbi:ACS family glucarate transporter-like MFS transporter [Microbacterium resistens]|uniref:ACS family glucarate transporter-like MFS transporter n=1 Tax=Microbacterium resistens TaxID=156977 RepID=A0ABU1SEW1_9MICO|nr:MFS transporter [Microbacterium resistens]MDR6868140.1 ACS family glucarate transporter-like MFS transporter [Microbacterium resistens]
MTRQLASPPRTAVGSRRYIIGIGLLLLVTLGYMDRINWSIAGSHIIEEFGLTTGQYGILTSVFSWAYLALMIPVGLMADRWGARLLLPISIIVWSIGAGMTGAATGLAALVIARLLLGAGESPMYPVGNSVISEWAPRQERARFTGLLNAGALFGPAIGAVVAAYLIATLSWHASFFILGGIGIVFGVIWMLVYNTPAKAAWLKPAERDFIIRERVDPQVAAQGYSSKPLTLPVLLRTGTMWSLLIAHGCAAYTNYLFLSFMPLYLEKERGLEGLGSGWVTGITYAVAAVGSIVVAYVSDRLVPTDKLHSGGRRKLVVTAMVAALPLLVLPFVDNVVAIVVLIAWVLIMITSAMTLNFALAGDLIQGNPSKGRVFALVQVGGNVFGLLAPIVTGFLVDGTGSYTIPFILAGLLLAVGATLTARFSRGSLAAKAQD